MALSFEGCKCQWRRKVGEYFGVSLEDDKERSVVDNRHHYTWGFSTLTTANMVIQINQRENNCIIQISTFHPTLKLVRI